MTHKQAVLKLLSDHKPHSHHELYGLGCVAHSRISDLRRDGHVIEAWREDGLYLYQLKAPDAQAILQEIRNETGVDALDEAAASPEDQREVTDGLTAVSLSTPSNRTQAEVSPLLSSAALQTKPRSTPDGDVLTLFGDAA